MHNPLVSIVTPFHNTSPYLDQCIQSVLEQTFRDFEYILVDNCSTDGSDEIAEKYARQDSRIRFIRRRTLLSQVRNYNTALEEISNGCAFVKIVQADDFLFPPCLESMLGVFEQSSSVGLVSSYWLKGDEVRGSGFPHATTFLPGPEVVRLFLRTGLWVFGSPTAVMYRADLLQKGVPFYDESQLHEDTDKCMEILKTWDFGFAHQVLSFSRADNDSISSAVRHLQPVALDRYILIQRHASAFLDQREASGLKSRSRSNYYRTLAQQALRFHALRFWQYHKDGLKTLGQTIHWGHLILFAMGECLWMAVNPGVTMDALLRKIRGRFTPLR